MARLGRTLAEGVDVFLLEVSDDKQFSYGDIYLNQNFVSRNLVQAQRGALLDWYRQICRGKVADETCVQAALEKMRDGGLRHDDQMADLLRRVRLDRHSGEEITQSLAALMSKGGGRWVVVGAMVDPGQDGAIMRDRRGLNEKLKEAAAQCGATFFDPSQLIADHGKSTVLAGDGADIYEYAEAFYPTLGRALARLMRDGAGATRRISPLPAPGSPKTIVSEIARSRTASGLSATWRKLSRYFGRRTKKLGQRIRSRSMMD